MKNVLGRREKKENESSPGAGALHQPQAARGSQGGEPALLHAL